MNTLLLVTPSVILFYLVILVLRRNHEALSPAAYYVLEFSGIPFGFFFIHLSQVEQLPVLGIAGVLMILQPIYWISQQQRNSVLH